jgi:PAS domain-containing protein
MQWFRDIVEKQQMGVAVYAAADDGADFVLRYLNPAGERFCNMPQADLAGRRIAEAFPFLAEIGLLDVFRRVWRSGAPETFLARRPDDSGVGRWVENRVFKVGTGEIASLFADVSARVEAQEALRQSEAILRQAQAIARMGSWHLDVRQDRLTWSDETYRIFGVAQGAPLGYADFLACIPADERETVDAAWQAALRGAPYDIVHRILVDGETDVRRGRKTRRRHRHRPGRHRKQAHAGHVQAARQGVQARWRGGADHRPLQPHRRGQ